MWELEKIQDFCPRDIESWNLAAAIKARETTVAKCLFLFLFFKEPRQLD